MLAQATATATADGAQSGGTDLTSVLIGATIAATALLLGQFVTPRYIARRDRYTQIVGAIDKAVENFVTADRAMGNLISAITSHVHGNPHGLDRAALTAQAATVTDHEVAMCASTLSMSLRLSASDPLASAFVEAHAAYFEISRTITSAVSPTVDTAGIAASIEEAATNRDAFLEQFASAMEPARSRLTRRA